MDRRTAPAKHGRSRAGLLLAAILVASAAVYWRALQGALVYDDLLLIGRNPLITRLANIPRLFTSGYWDFLGLKDAQYIGYWRPLTAIVQTLIWPLAGSAPGPYHAVCLAVHLGASAAAFLLARALCRDLWIAAATALLFTLHPAHVESVAWISALNDPLFGCLALFSLERFLAWRARGSHGLPLAALAFFSLALLAKELAAALVPLLVLLDLLRPRTEGEAEVPAPAVAARSPLERIRSTFAAPLAPARAYGPFALAFALYLLARMLVFESPWAGFDRITTDFRVDALRLWQLRLELFGGGLEILTLPIELNLFRPFRPAISAFDPALLRAAAFSAVFAALLLACLLGGRRRAAAALVVIPAGLLPALIKVQSLGQFPLCERFLYLSAFGFALGAALLLQQAFARRTATLVVLVLGALYGLRAHERIGVFHDEETLFLRSAEQSPRSVYVQWGLGRVLLERFGATSDRRFLTEAEEVFGRAEKLLAESKEPSGTDLMVTSRDYLQVNLGYAYCYIYGDQLSGAIATLEDLAKRIETIRDQEREARERGLRVPEQFLDLEKVYTALGIAQFRYKRYEQAEASFQHALELQPASAEAHQNFGRLLADRGSWERAVQQFEVAVALRPGEPEDRLLLAQALQTAGKSERAEELARALLTELPGRAEPLVVLATGALKRQESGKALTWLDRALAIDPRNALAWYQKARAFLIRNEPASAMTAFRNAVELDPTSFEAHYDCAAFLLSQGAIAEARPYLVRAYGLAPEASREALARNLRQMTFEEPGPLFELATVDLERSELVAALDWVERGLALDPANAPALLLKARALRRLKRESEAVPAFHAACERAPGSYEAWSESGTYLHELGRKEEAAPVLRHALELEPPAAWPKELRESSEQGLRKLLGE